MNLHYRQHKKIPPAGYRLTEKNLLFFIVLLTGSTPTLASWGGDSINYLFNEVNHFGGCSFSVFNIAYLVGARKALLAFLQQFRPFYILHLSPRRNETTQPEAGVA